MISMLLSATAHETGWPDQVKPWTNEASPCWKGSARRSETIIAPSGA
jgi:hypothetical protein